MSRWLGGRRRSPGASPTGRSPNGSSLIGSSLTDPSPNGFPPRGFSPTGRSRVGLVLAGLALLGLLAGCATPAWRDAHAIELAPQVPRDAWLGPGIDVYAFTLTAPARVVIESETPASGWTLDPDATLLDAKGRVVARDWRSGEGENFRLTRSLPAGRWYLEVTDGGGCRLMQDCEAHRRYTVILAVDPASAGAATTRDQK